MALVTLPTQQQALTTVEKQIKVKTVIAQRIQQAFQMLAGTQSQLAQVVWANPEGLNPQEVLDAVGHDSAALFQVSSLVAQVLSVSTGLPPAAVMPPGWSYEIAADGTVKVTKDAD
jgi:hypothetical protein